MNKIIIAIIVLAVIGLAGYFLFRNPGAPGPSPTPSPTASAPMPSEFAPGPVIQETPTPSKIPLNKQNIVVYTDAGYSPSLLTIKKGEIVIFKNQSSRTMWPASAVHPTHKLYPTTGGCLGSTFDACKGIQPGNSWPFKFDISGSWKYHDHLNPGDIGTIVVE